MKRHIIRRMQENSGAPPMPGSCGRRKWLSVLLVALTVIMFALASVAGAKKPPPPAGESPDFGNTQAAAEAVALLPYSSGGAAVNDDYDTQDWFTFTVGADGWFIVEALQFDTKAGDFIVRLISLDAAHIMDVYEGCNNNSCGAACGPAVIYETSEDDNEAFIKAKLAAGDYYVQVESIDVDSGFNQGVYELNITATAEGPDYGDTPASADAVTIAPLPFITLIDGEIGDNVYGVAWSEPNGDGYQVDWFSFNVATAGTVVVNLDKYGGYQRVRLYANNGTDLINSGAVAVNAGSTDTDGDTALSGDDYVYDDSDGDNVSYISVAIPAGGVDFYVMVEHTSEDGKDLSRSIGALTISYTSDTVYFADCDGDLYGCDPADDNCVSVFAVDNVDAASIANAESRPLCPNASIWTAGQFVAQSGDCNDNSANANPGNFSDATCDGVDDDCDGFTDEDVVAADLISFYRDADADGYGDGTFVIKACTAPVGYVDNSDDCNDADPNINPDVFDICGNGIDENCDGTDRACVGVTDGCAGLSDVPLEALGAPGPPPIVMLVLDNSGSMAWDVLCPGEPDGLFHDGSNYWTSALTGSAEYWKAQWSEWNVLWYDPHLQYHPWYGYNDADMDDPFNRPPDDPADTTSSGGSQDLESTFDRVDSVTNIDGGNDVIYAHYYTWSNSESRPYLVQIYGNSGSYSIRYWPINPPSDGELDNDTHVLPERVVGANDPPADVVTGRTAYDERQNFANWYQYYRNRQLSANAALSDVVGNTDGMIMGGTTINVNTATGFFPALYIDDTADDDNDGITNRQELITWLFRSGQSSGGTPLRKTYTGVGEYLMGGTSKGDSPYYSEEEGGSCQSAFIIMMTDGYYNGANPGVGNADVGDEANDDPFDSEFDGAPYGDEYGDTLGDCAMFFYETDLRPDLSNEVPTFAGDQATHQHAVTYTLSFGINIDDWILAYPDCPGGYPDDPNACPDWPYLDNKSEQEKIVDLWHAAVNGRGKYLNAKSGAQLASQLRAILAEVKKRKGSGAAVAVNTQTLEEETLLFQGSYNFSASGWIGNLTAYDIDQYGFVTVPPVWTLADALDSMANPEYDFADGGRNIWTIGKNGGMTFTAAQVAAGNFTSDQAYKLGTNDTARENLINYIRGDRSLEIQDDGSGTYRHRASLMGDIVHSAPVHVNDYVYVGANDGMLHVVNATTGEEVLAYVPGLVYHNLENFASPAYGHRYFADMTPFLGYSDASDASKPLGGGDRLLIGGLGKGGKGFYCLKVDEFEDQYDNGKFADIDGDGEIDSGTIGPVVDGLGNVIGDGGDDKDDFYDDPTVSFDAADVLWEYPNSSSTANEVDNLGFSYSHPTIVNTEDTATNGGKNQRVAAWGNGYDSTNGQAALYVVEETSGDLLKLIETGYGSNTCCDGIDNDGDGDIDELDEDEDLCNGLSTPVFLDTDGDFQVDRAYAGDLQGNVWKFDLSGEVGNWDVAFKDSSGNPVPLFQAKGPVDTDGDGVFDAVKPQPIVTRVTARKHCQDGYEGYIIMFGTGRFNGENDWEDTDLQAVYGIWDWTDEWDESAQEILDNADASVADVGLFSLTDETLNLGALTTVDPSADPPALQLDNIVNSGNFSPIAQNITLLRQEREWDADYLGINYTMTTDNAINWFNVRRYMQLRLDGTASDYGVDHGETDGIDNDGDDFTDETGESDGTPDREGYHVGWYFQLPEPGERVVAPIIPHLDYALIVSLRPEGDVCNAGGISYFYFLNYCSGAAEHKPFLDLNMDGVLNDDDYIEKDGVQYYPSGIGLNDIYYEPTIVGSEASALDYFLFGSDNAFDPTRDALLDEDDISPPSGIGDGDDGDDGGDGDDGDDGDGDGGNQPGGESETTGVTFWRFLNTN